MSEWCSCNSASVGYIFVHLNISDMFICLLQKRYSLAVGPPKKVPKVKGVESAAVQAFLRRKEEEKRKKGNC